MRPSIALAGVGVASLVIALILMPVTGCGCSKAAAKATMCFLNFKQQALGLAMYAADNDAYPARDLWMNGVRPYVKTESILHAPEFAKDAPNAYGYAFNATLSHAREPKHPERVILVYESANPIRNASDKLTSLPHPGRHEGRNSLAYADGHVRREKP